MSFFKIFVSTVIVLLLALPASRADAQDAAADFAERFAPGSIDTTERAKAALDEIVAVRTAVDNLYYDQRVACYSRFFASACMSDVRQKQRAAQSKIRKIEIEANAFLRKEKAAERDRALAERENRANQQPGGRSRPITGTARESASEVTVPAPAPTPTPSETPAEAPAEAPADSKP